MKGGLCEKRARKILQSEGREMDVTKSHGGSSSNDPVLYMRIPLHSTSAVCLRSIHSSS